MTARKTGPKTLAELKPPLTAEVDVEAWLNGFTPATVKATLFRKGHLLPRILELQNQAKALTPSEDTGVDDDEKYVAVVEEHNRLAAELHESGEVFEFVPFDQIMVKRAREKAEADGVTDEDEDGRMTFGYYLIAETCVSHPFLTGKVLLQLREKLGDIALNAFGEAFNEAQQVGSGMQADFLPLALHSRDTEE